MQKDIEYIEQQLAGNLPIAYKEFIALNGCGFRGDCILIYSGDEILERNSTFEVQKYCPGYVAIGDDSGGRSIVVALDEDDGPVYLVDQGYMDVDGFEVVSDSLAAWFISRCQVEV